MGPGRVRLPSTLPVVEFVEDKFFISGAIKLVTLLACSFRYNSSNRPSEIKNRTQLSLTNCTTLLPHHLEMTMTGVKTGAVALP